MKFQNNRFRGYKEDVEGFNIHIQTSLHLITEITLGRKTKSFDSKIWAN